jgi:hypothetical protein
MGVVEGCFGDVGMRTVESGLLEAPRTRAKHREANLQVGSGKESHVSHASLTLQRDTRSLRINRKLSLFAFDKDSLGAPIQFARAAAYDYSP